MTRYGPGMYQVWSREGAGAAGIAAEGRRLSVVRAKAHAEAERLAARNGRFYEVVIYQLNDHLEPEPVEIVTQRNVYPVGTVESTYGTRIPDA